MGMLLLLLLLQERIRGVKALFRDKSQTEFIIATIPTQLGINESRRLLGTLREEGIPCKRIIVNQVCVCVYINAVFLIVVQLPL
jgi:arsenite-transporting ATPase